MRVNDAISGAVLVVFAVAEIAYTRTFPSLHGQSYGPDLFPVIIGVGMLGCGLLLIARGFNARQGARRAGNPLTSEAPASATPAVDAMHSQLPAECGAWVDLSNITDSKPARINALLVVVSLLIYIFLSDQVGFIPLSIVTIGVLLYRMGSSVMVSCTVALVTTVIIQILFAKVLLVPLPAGWMQAGFLQKLIW